MEEGGSRVERKKGWREKVGKVALVVVSFLPLVVAFAVPDFRIATTCAFGASVFDFALDFYRLKTGRTKVFPKVLNAVFLSLFGILTVLMWADTKRDTVYIVWDGFIIMGTVTFCITVMTLAGHPFVKDFMVDSFDDACQLESPLVLHSMRFMNWAWTLMFFMMAAVYLVGAVTLTVGSPGEQFQLAFCNPAYLTFVFLIAGFGLNAYYPKRFKDPAFRSKLLRKYDKEMEAWCTKYPEQEWSKLYFEGKAQANEERGDDDDALH